MPFQTSVNLIQAPAMEGDFSSANRWASAQAQQGSFVAGGAGVTVGRFAWADSNQNTVANTGTGVPTGFVHREQGAPLITTYLAETGNLIPAGFIVTLHKGGDFWVRNAGAGAVTVGMKAFANNTTGAVSFAATGATVAGATETKWSAESAAAAGELVMMTSLPVG